jgi:hypothetical protein
MVSECLTLASTATDPLVRQDMLRRAEYWTRKAEEAQARAQQPQPTDSEGQLSGG